MTLIVWAIGVAAILPVWRGAAGALSMLIAAIAFLSLVIGTLAVWFSGPAIWAYLGAWGGTLGRCASSLTGAEPNSRDRPHGDCPPPWRTRSAAATAGDGEDLLGEVRSSTT